MRVILSVIMLLSLCAASTQAATTLVADSVALNLANRLVALAPAGNITIAPAPAPAAVASPNQTALVNNFNFGFINGVALNLPGAGIMLTNGNMLGTSNNLATLGDVDVETAVAVFPGSSSDASSLQFSFTTAAGLNYVTMNVIFATNEQIGNVNFRDAAVIMVDGVNQGKFPNGDPLSNINTSSISPTLGGVITGFTNVSSMQTIVAPLNPLLTTHTIKIAIADNGDALRDSAILLAGLQATVPPPGGGVGGGGGATTGVTIIQGAAPGAVPPIGAVDPIAPRLRLVGNASVHLQVGDLYLDPGAIAVDNVDGNLTGAIITKNPVNTGVAGVYTVQYSVTDAAGNNSTLTRTVTVHAAPGLPATDVLPPVVTPPADLLVTATDYRGISVLDPAVAAFFASVIAVDNVAVVGRIVNNAPAILPVGQTVVTFSATDAAGNIGTAQATVTVVGTSQKMLPLPLSVDSDRDRIPDSWEVANFLNLTVVGTVPDSDADTLPDYWEVAVFGNLLTASLVSDADLDGLSDVLEYQLGTNPLSPNSNPLGVSTDSWSVIFSNNPSDTDGDGVIDALEDATTVLNPAMASRVPVAINSGVSYSIDAGAGNQLRSVHTALTGAGAPANILPAFGVLSFAVKTAVVGGTATVRITTSSPFGSGAQFYKVNQVGAYSLIPAANVAVVSSNIVDLVVTDGGPLDLDGVANGIIVDPIAIGSTPQILGGSGPSGGCAIAPAAGFDPLLPTLLLLSLFYLLRRRSARN